MSFKDSRVEWIGEIPSHWEISKIKYQTYINKHTLNDQTTDDYIIQYIDIGNVNSEGQIQELQQYKFSDAPSRARRIVKKNDLLISTVRTYLKAITSILDDVEDNMICSTGFAVLTPKDTIDSLYLHYLSRSEIYIDEIVSRSTGVSYPAINASEIGALECILPPLDEQRLIGKFLYKKSSEVESIIQSKLKYMELLEQQRQSIITEAVIKGLNPNVKMKDSGVEWIGEIPEHWKLVKIKHLIVSKKGAIKTGPFGSQLTNNDMNGIDVKIYNQRTVLDNDFVKGDYYISKEKYEELKSFEVFSGDILITTRGTIGKASIVPNNIECGILHPCLIRMQLCPNLIEFKLVQIIFNETNFIKKQIELLSNATTIEVIYSETLKNLSIVLPSKDEQQELLIYIENILKDYNEVIYNQKNQIEKLKAYRQALIYEAVTGKMDVRDLELDEVR